MKTPRTAIPHLLVALSLSTIASHAAAKPLLFDYKDPKGISALSLSLDSPLEPIVGYAKGITGTLTFDPEHPDSVTGTISVAAKSVQFAHDGYTATAQNFALESDKFPELKLQIRKVIRGTQKPTAQAGGRHFEGDVLADFTCRGITKPKTLHVTADYLPGKAEERTGGQQKGDLLVIRSRMSVSRKEHGISEGIPDAMVGDTIEVGIAVVGIHSTEESTSAQKPGLLLSRPTLAETALETKLPRLGGGAAASIHGLQTGKERATALLFLNEQCGVSIYYRQRLLALEKEFAAKGIRFIGIRAGRRQEANVIDLPERKSLAMPFYDDAQGALMALYGIRQSLTFVVLDPEDRVLYKGGFDDNVDAAKVKRTPIRAALADIVAGRKVKTPEFKTLGCAMLPMDNGTSRAQK